MYKIVESQCCTTETDKKKMGGKTLRYLLPYEKALTLLLEFEYLVP